MSEFSSMHRISLYPLPPLCPPGQNIGEIPVHYAGLKVLSWRLRQHRALHRVVVLEKDTGLVGPTSSARTTNELIEGVSSSVVAVACANKDCDERHICAIHDIRCGKQARQMFIGCLAHHNRLLVVFAVRRIIHSET